MANTFDGQGRICSVGGAMNASCATGQYASNVAYAQQGAVQNLNLNNGVVGESWQYSPRLQPSALSVVTGATPLLNLQWAYGSAGADN